MMNYISPVSLPSGTLLLGRAQMIGIIKANTCLV